MTKSPSSAESLSAPAPRSLVGTDIALVAVFAAVIAGLSVVPAIPMAAGVPITLQTAGVFLAGAVLGPWRGFLAVSLYLVVGFAGLPIFAAGASGIAPFVGPSAGYLLSFPLAAAATGYLVRLLVRSVRPRLWAAVVFASCLIANLVLVHPLGIAGLVVRMGLSWHAALVVDLAFVPGDVLKSIVVGILTAAVFRAFPALRAHSRPARPRAERSA